MAKTAAKAKASPERRPTKAAKAGAEPRPTKVAKASPLSAPPTSELIEIVLEAARSSTDGDLATALPPSYAVPKLKKLALEVADQLVAEGRLFAVKAGKAAKAKRYLLEDPARRFESIVAERIARASGAKIDALIEGVPAKERALDLIDRACASGALHRFGTGKGERYFAEDPIATLDRLVPELLGGHSRRADELLALVEARAPGHEVAFKAWLPSAIARGLVFESKAEARGSKPVYAREPDLGQALREHFTAIKRALVGYEAKGVARDRLLAMVAAELGLSPPAPVTPRRVESDAQARNGHTPDREVFLDGLRSLAREHADGALLSVRELRSRIALDKPRFDEIALALSRTGIVVLHYHDHPEHLPITERAQLVEDPQGTHYVGIALRRNAHD